ncbi:MAG: ABC transporter permease, partial [Thermomicrobiales bacterium]
MTRHRLAPVVSSFLAILLAFIVGGLFLELRGHDAIDAYRILFARCIDNQEGLTETFKKMAPVLIGGGGLLIARKAGVWNIGIDGQV